MDEESMDDTYEDMRDVSSAVSLDDCSIQTTLNEMRKFAAKWILKTGETRSLTRAATQGVIEDVGYLVDFVTDSLVKCIMYYG